MCVKEREKYHTKTMSSSTMNIKSFHNYSTLFVAIYILFLLNSFINHQQEKAVDALSISTSVQQQQQQQQLNTTRKDNRVALNYLLFSSNSKNKQQDSKLNELLMDNKHNHVSDAVNIQLANSVWYKMHKNVQEFARQRTLEARPVINRFLEDANVTLSCRKSLNSVLDRIDQLDNWAMESK